MPRGDVVIQNPQPGAQVPRGTPVNLQESTGRKANGKPCVIE
jgi:beta-lactam-binding protein with PASTA domain